MSQKVISVMAAIATVFCLSVPALAEENPPIESTAVRQSPLPQN